MSSLKMLGVLRLLLDDDDSTELANRPVELRIRSFEKYDRATLEAAGTAFDGGAKSVR